MGFGLDQIKKIHDRNIEKFKDPEYARNAEKMIKVVAGREPLPSRDVRQNDGMDR